MKTLLIADDEEHLRLLVATTLSGPDYRIIEARDGDEALHLAHSAEPDLMILDWMMPQRSGIEVLEALRDDPATTGIPVILLTAKAQKADRNQAIMLGIRGYLVKPFSPLQLIELVDKVLSTP